MNPVDMISVHCDLCGSDDARVIIQPKVTGADPTRIMSASGGIRGTQRIVRCRRCGLVYASPRPRPEIVVLSYACAEDQLYVQGGAGRESTFARCARLIEKWRRPPGRLLDVGCAAGFFVQQAKLRGWEAAGIEPCAWLVEWGKKNLGGDLATGILPDARFPDGTFDVLTMWDVLEHTPDPSRQLAESLRILKPGGILVVNYPDFGSILARISGRHWWFLLSNHLTYFTRRTIRAMLEKNGFVVERFSMHWQVLPLGHLANIFHIYSPGLSRFGARLLKALRLSRFPFPYYAAQTNVVARKPATGLPRN